jgi:hypothetical protein
VLDEDVQDDPPMLRAPLWPYGEPVKSIDVHLSSINSGVDESAILGQFTARSCI